MDRHITPQFLVDLLETHSLDPAALTIRDLSQDGDSSEVRVVGTFDCQQVAEELNTINDGDFSGQRKRTRTMILTGAGIIAAGVVGNLISRES